MNRLFSPKLPDKANPLFDLVIHDRGSFIIYVNIFFPFFDHIPTPNLQLFTFNQPPTYCEHLHLRVDYPIKK